MYPKLKSKYATYSALFTGVTYPVPVKYDNTAIQKMIFNHYQHYRLPLDPCEDETEALAEWHDYFAARMDEIMLRYSKLYDYTQITVDPLETVDIAVHNEEERDISHTGTQTNDSTDHSLEETRNNTESQSENSTTSASSASSNSNSQSEEHASGNNINEALQKFSDTPQGAVQNLDDGYLTNVTQNDSNASNAADTESESSSNDTSISSSNAVGEGSTISESAGSTSSEGERHNTLTNNLTEDNDVESDMTKKGREGYPAGRLLSEYRDSIIEINSQLLNELADLFYRLYD